MHPGPHLQNLTYFTHCHIIKTFLLHGNLKVPLLIVVPFQSSQLNTYRLSNLVGSNKYVPPQEVRHST